jgi:cytidylate kinase
MVITIDGPVASGKSTAAKQLASLIGFYYLNTGLLYRAAAYILITSQNVKKIDQLKNLPEKVFGCIDDIVYSFVDGEPVVYYKEHDISSFLKLPEYDQPASIISTYPIIRKKLLKLQHVIGKQYNIVADGRDCGSVVYPNAEYKFFLTASIEVRATRMSEYLQKKDGTLTEISELCLQIAQRDKRDSERSIAPLKIPVGAITIDNGNMTIEQTVQKMLRYITC